MNWMNVKLHRQHDKTSEPMNQSVKQDEFIPASFSEFLNNLQIGPQHQCYICLPSIFWFAAPPQLVSVRASRIRSHVFAAKQLPKECHAEAVITVCGTQHRSHQTGAWRRLGENFNLFICFSPPFLLSFSINEASPQN